MPNPPSRGPMILKLAEKVLIALVVILVFAIGHQEGRKAEAADHAYYVSKITEGR